MRHKRIVARLAVLALFLLAFAAGCTPKTVVPLNYAVLGNMPGSCNGNVMVVAFKDVRKQASIGRDGDGYVLNPGSDVADWVGWSLYEELRAAGCETSYHGTREGFSARTVVSGEVLDVKISPMGKTVWKGMVKARMTTEVDGKAYPGETFVSEVEKPIIFGVSSREEVLTEALQGVLEQMVPRVLERSAK